MGLRVKLFCILFVNLTMTLLVAGIGWWSVSYLQNGQADIIATGNALKSAMNVDMMHDALRADVYAALLSSSGLEGVPGKEEIMTDLSEHINTIKSSFDEVANGKINDTVKAEVADALPAVDKYANSAQHLVELAFKDKDKDKAVGGISEFASVFSMLEEKLGELGDNVAKSAEEAGTHGLSNANTAKSSLVGFLILAVIIGTAISWYITSSVSSALIGVIGNLRESAQDVGGISDHLTKVSEKLSNSASEQAAAVQETVASVAEISSMVAQTVENANTSLGIAQKVTDRTEDGTRIMERMVSSMESIQQANSQLQDMVNIIKEISAKTGVINDIVFKTQLLAFNASIEAARAGQHGRGFAVVAEEVGNLADMSGQAAKEIQVLLEGSEKQVHEIVDSTDIRVKEGQTVSREALNTFSVITKDVLTIVDQVRNISNATNEQEKGLEQTSAAMTQMDKVAQGNNGMARDSSETVNQLSQRTTLLVDVVEALRGVVFGKNSNSSAINNKNVVSSAPPQSKYADEIDNQLTM